jgi:PAS domain S-box-containing protein
MSAPTIVDTKDRVKLLLVDDRQEDLDTLALVLEDPGYELVMARSGAEALRHLLMDDYAVVVLDVLLPGMDGFEVASLIKERDRSRDTPILFLTAAGGDMGFIYQAYAAGGVDYLAKPIDPRVLTAKIAIFAELFRKERRIRQQAEQLRDAERKQKKLELAELRRQNERRYRSLADAVPAIVWTAKPTGEIAFVNRHCRDYTGLSKVGELKKTWLETLHPEDRPGFESGWQAAVSEEREYNAECRVRRASDGEYRWHLCHAVPEREPDGSCIGWVATMTDTEDLRRAIQARDEFLAIASHELRTPLATLDLAIHGLRRVVPTAGPVEPPTVHKKLDTAERQIGRLDKLVGALLDVTRIAGRRALIEPVDCDLATIAREVAERLQGEADRVRSTIRLSSPSSVPGHWDPLRIDQVLTNLLTNALRHGPGKPIDLIVEQEAGNVQISVRDRGEGIPKEQLPLLFQRFQRGPERKAPGGLGLGLFISRQIAREHGGDIAAASTPGNGATFTVVLPLKTARRTVTPA